MDSRQQKIAPQNIAQKKVAIVGPTASGKTALSVLLAQQLHQQGYPAEILSADSRQVYQELTIGTAKPTVEEQGGIPHHLLDLVPPDQSYSVAEYRTAAERVLAGLVQRDVSPIITGGTGFYLQAVLQDQLIPDVAPDPVFRDQMQQLLETQGTEALYALLQRQDPVRAEALHPNDHFRVIRALEIIQATGAPVPPTGLHNRGDVLWLGLTVSDRSVLWRRIDARIEAMLAQGWLNEVEQICQRYGEIAEALQITHGYPELVNVLQGRSTLEEAVASMQIQIHQYARRQLTWFRKNPEIHWFMIDEQPWDELVTAAGEQMSRFLDEAS